MLHPRSFPALVEGCASSKGREPQVVTERGAGVCGKVGAGPLVCPVTVTGVGHGKGVLVCSGAWVLGPCVCPMTVTGAGAAVHAVLHTLTCLLFTGEESREEAACRGHAAWAVAMLVVEPELLIKAVSDLRNTYKAASLCLGFPGGSDSKESACNAKTCVRSLDWEDPLEKGMTTHSSILLLVSASRCPVCRWPRAVGSLGLDLGAISRELLSWGAPGLPALAPLGCCCLDASGTQGRGPS